MPKVSEAHRDARREQIARAAIACLHRKGFANTTMADIIAESGLSAGAIYSNFTNKAELARYIAATLVAPRILAIPSGARSPREVVESMLEGFWSAEVDFTVVVQVWAESTVDAELHAVMNGVVTSLRTAIGDGIAGWVAQRHPDNAAAETERLARVLLMICQGYIVNAALFGASDPAEYLASIGELFE